MTEGEPESPRLLKLQQEMEKIRRKMAQEKKRLSDQARKEDTRRKILAGAVLLEAAKTDAQLQGTIETLLKAKLTRDDDRALFGLPPLAGSNERKTG